jgi:hypothetical protein
LAAPTPAHAKPIALDNGSIALTGGDVLIPCEGWESMFSSRTRGGRSVIALGEFELALDGDAFSHLLANGRRAAAEVAARHSRMRASLVFDPSAVGVDAAPGAYLRVRASLSTQAANSLFQGSKRDFISVISS